MLLWYAEFIRKQSAQLHFRIRIKAALYCDSGRSRRVLSVQFNLHLHIRTDGSGFFQDICFTFLPYDCRQRTDSDFLSLGSGLFRLELILEVQLRQGTETKRNQRADENSGEKNTPYQPKLLRKSRFLGNILENSHNQGSADQ